MRLSPSVRAALLIAVLVATYFGARMLFREAPAAEEEALAEQPFTVIAETVAPSEWRDEVLVRGRTEAIRHVIVRAETSGAVRETPVPRGAQVKAGDVLCRLQIDSRRAALSEAEAALAKARLDYNAARELAAEGFRSETAVAGARANLNLAEANVEKARVELEKTAIKAPFDGVFDNRAVEVGDFLNVGQPCGSVIQRSPFLITGAVSEQQVGKISVGDKGRARLSTGEVIEGELRFVARAADPQTRTFEVELEVPNEDGELRDGVTAEFTIFAGVRNAVNIQRSALTLDNDGRVGVRIVQGDNTVAFRPVTLLGEGENGVWVAGLEAGEEVITRGQDFVSAGQKVAIARAEDAGALAGQSGGAAR